MTRLTRRTAALVAAATAVALAGPALADATVGVGVTYTTADGTRQFAVTTLDGVTPLTSFTFGSDLRQPFRTVVTDQNRLLNSTGYHVNATMTNLYLKTGATYDYTTYIPSNALSLTYGATPLTGAAALPVTPKVLLTGVAGALGTCADADVAAILGLAAPLLGPLDILGLAALTAPLKSICQALGDLTATPISALATGVDQVVSTALSLPNLPFALTGAAQGGTFSNPSYVGPVAAGDPARLAGPPAATSKRVMTGTSLVQTSGDLTGLLGSLTAALQTQVAALPAVGAAAKVTLVKATEALSGSYTALSTALAGLPAVDATELLNKLTATVQSLTGLDLSSVTGSYSAYPVLGATPAASTAGTYEGTLVVDFFES